MDESLDFNFSSAGNYMFKVNNRNTRARCEICAKLTIKIPERRQAHAQIHNIISKITHQLWHDYPFSQRNKTTKRAVGLEVGEDGEEKGVGQNLVKGGVGDIRGSS